MNSNTGHLIKFDNETMLKKFQEMKSGYFQVPEILKELSNAELGDKEEVYVDGRKKLVREMRKLDKNYRKTSRRKA